MRVLEDEEWTNMRDWIKPQRLHVQHIAAATMTDSYTTYGLKPHQMEERGKKEKEKYWRE